MTGKPICATVYISGLLLFNTIFILMQPTVPPPPALVIEAEAQLFSSIST